MTDMFSKEREDCNMNHVIDYFKEFAFSLLGKSFPSEYTDVVDGMKYYIKEHQLDEYENAEIASKRELVRFRGISPSDFVAFFSNYELRSKIEMFRRDCSNLALNRLSTGSVISEEQFKENFQAYYQLSADLASDPRYSSWLSRIGKDISIDLRFAANLSDVVSEEVVNIFRIQNNNISS